MPARLHPVIWLILAAATSWQAHGQVPFFNGGVATFEPEISTVTTGDQMVVGPTVSHDRKYVTIGGQFQSSRVLRIETVPFQTTTVGGAPVPPGLVGGARPAAVSGANADNLNVSRPATLRAGTGGKVLGQPGMTRLVDLDP